jgi:hypothetical protein
VTGPFGHGNEPSGFIKGKRASLLAERWWDSKVWSWVSRDPLPRMTVLVRACNNLPDSQISCATIISFSRDRSSRSYFYAVIGRYQTKNLDPETSYPDRFLWFSSVPLYKYCGRLSVWATTAIFHILPNSLYIQNMSELLIWALNNHKWDKSAIKSVLNQSAFTLRGSASGQLRPVSIQMNRPRFSSLSYRLALTSYAKQSGTKKDNENSYMMGYHQQMVKSICPAFSSKTKHGQTRAASRTRPNIPTAQKKKIYVRCLAAGWSRGSLGRRDKK